MGLAPILVSVYTRVDHLKKCIGSLKENPLAKCSILYIISDAPFKDDDRAKVDEVRKLAKTINGFKNVIILARKKNLGSNESILQAINEVINNFGKVIFMEDDNFVSPNFLEFINKGLDFYENDKRIFSISAYNYPIKIPAKYSKDIYAWRGFSPWGFGVWNDKWNAVDWELTKFDEFIQNKKKIREFNNIAAHVLPMLVRKKASNTRGGDTLIHLDMFLKNQLSIFPITSKVRNYGTDGSGEHKVVSKKYVNQNIDDGSRKVEFIDNIQPDESINKLLRKHFNISFKKKFKQYIKYVIGLSDYY